MGSSIENESAEALVLMEIDVNRLPGPFLMMAIVIVHSVEVSAPDGPRCRGYIAKTPTTRY
jgi:hypothetical protein